MGVAGVRMSTKRALPLLLFVALAAAVLSACSSGGGGQSSGVSGDAGAGGAAQAGGGEAGASAPDAEFAEREAEGSGGDGGLGELDRRVVKTAELGLRAEDVRESAAEAQRIVAGFGGSVLSARVDDADGGVYAELVLTVPSERFEEALDELRGLGRRVTTDTVTGEDVTEEFVDLRSRERNLKAAEESLLKLYDRAGSIEDTLDVQAELTEVRGEIERVQGRLKYLENRTELSRISLRIEPSQPTAVAAERPPWDPTAVAGSAWYASLNVLQAIATAVISAVVFGWWIVPFAALGLVGWRRRRNRPQVPSAPDS
jgi:hypothetical protein